MYQHTAHGQSLLGQARALHTEALDNQALRRYDKAARCLEEALTLRRTALVSPSAVICATLESLAHLYQLMGKHRRRRVTLEQVLTEKTGLFGPHHVEVCATLGQLQDACAALGEFDAVNEIGQRAWEAKTGNVHGYPDPAKAPTAIATALKEHQRRGGVPAPTHAAPHAPGSDSNPNPRIAAAAAIAAKLPPHLADIFTLPQVSYATVATTVYAEPAGTLVNATSPRAGLSSPGSRFTLQTHGGGPGSPPAADATARSHDGSQDTSVAGPRAGTGTTPSTPLHLQTGVGFATPTRTSSNLAHGGAATATPLGATPSATIKNVMLPMTGDLESMLAAINKIVPSIRSSHTPLGDQDQELELRMRSRQLDHSGVMSGAGSTVENLRALNIAATHAMMNADYNDRRASVRDPMLMAVVRPHTVTDNGVETGLTPAEFLLQYGRAPSGMAPLAPELTTPPSLVPPPPPPPPPLPPGHVVTPSDGPPLPPMPAAPEADATQGIPAAAPAAAAAVAAAPARSANSVPVPVGAGAGTLPVRSPANALDTSSASLGKTIPGAAAAGSGSGSAAASGASVLPPPSLPASSGRAASLI